jgi:hypothetical protein
VARNKPTKGAAPADAPPPAPPPEGAQGRPGGRFVEPAQRPLSAEGVPAFGERDAPMVPLAEQAPIVVAEPPPPPPDSPAPVAPRRWVVAVGGRCMVGGHVVVLKAGKVLDPRSYDVEAVRRAGNIVLREE